VRDQLWWYVARSGGITAWAMLTLSVVLGLALSTKVLGGRPRPNWLLDLHRFTAGAAVVFSAVHVGALVLDDYLPFGPTEIFVPFTSPYRPEAVAWGVVGLYLLLAVEITSLLRRRVPTRLWRATHFLTFPLFGAATAHAITAGSDAASVPMQVALIGATVLVGGLTALRLFPAGTQPAHTGAPR
jgi:predicted ferric reductase